MHKQPETAGDTKMQSAGVLMQSVNFEFIRDKRPYLADLGGFAEQYLVPDPQSALVKIRTLTEKVVDDIYIELGIDAPEGSTLFERMNDASFRENVTPAVLSKLHLLRTMGNKAAHGDEGTGEIAPRALREAYDILCWVHMTLDRGGCKQFVDYRCPSSAKPHREEAFPANDVRFNLGATPVGRPPGQSRQPAARNSSRAMGDAERKLNQTLRARMEEQRKAKPTRKSKDERKQIKASGESAANELNFSEAETRKYLVDIMLATAGWDVGPNGKTTPHVGQEVKVLHQGTKSGEGFADYVLWGDDGKPLAVVEVKKTAKEPSLGRKQAQGYADGLEKDHGCRPVIFYTNGFDLWIWNDHKDVDEPDRLLRGGFYSKDSLEYLHFQRSEAKDLLDPEALKATKAIAGRPYQKKALQQVLGRFAQKHRKALIIQATGTGKTRVAVALSSILLQTNQAKRVLFLCDRRELRKQASNAFKQLLPNAPRVTVNRSTHKDREQQIYLATYPSMKQYMETFDPGFFDLVIADESHRSIYNRYKDLFSYFDARQVGLTATPVQFIDRNTYQLFQCEDQEPTVSYLLEDAIAQKYLNPFEVKEFQTEFQRDGMKFSDMSPEQKAQLEEQVNNAENFEYTSAQLDRLIFNKDTCRLILRNLMEEGIRDASGQYPGKTIIFARNHRHAVLIKTLFDEIYPQYGGSFCTVIDSHDPRAEQLIDDFKGQGEHDIQIAISVDMLDTGIDVPEIVNLVFAKPVKSYVKFMQMIGRGTRLCPDLFGPGKDKEKFLIFDHWGNFEYFGEKYTDPSSARQKSMLEQLFEARLELATIALNKPDLPVFEHLVDLLHMDISSLEATGTISVREAWREIKKLKDKNLLKQFDPATQVVLHELAPLMRERNIRGFVDAHEFDLLMARLETAWLQGDSKFQDYRGKLLNEVSRLQMHMQPVKARAQVIQKVKDTNFWKNVTFEDLEVVRTELRSIMECRARAVRPDDFMSVVDIAENPDHVHTADREVKMEGLEGVTYRKRLEELLKAAPLAGDKALQRIRAGKSVSAEALKRLQEQIRSEAPDVDLKKLIHLYPKAKGHLDLALRMVVGLDAEAVEERFKEFAGAHGGLNSDQQRFLAILKKQLAEFGAIDPDHLDEAPFTSLHEDGIYGIFEEAAQRDELFHLVASFSEPDTNRA